MNKLISLALLSSLALPYAGAGAPAKPDGSSVRLRAWGTLTSVRNTPADRKILAAFRQRYPSIDPVSTTGLQLSGSRTEDMVPLMQIAGDIAPDVLHVNFRQSHTYIQMNLLYPLDDYVEQLAGVSLPGGWTLGPQEYAAALSGGPGWKDLESRVPAQIWPVIRRRCPQGSACRYLRDKRVDPPPDHEHVWTFPVGPLVVALTYDRTMLTERGLEPRAPRDWEELMRWAKILTDPPKNEYGLNIALELPGWSFLSFLYSAGGEVVRQGSDGQWRCVLDSEQAVDAAYFFARLAWEKVERDGQVYRGVIGSSSGVGGARCGLEFRYLDQRFITFAEEQNTGIGPVPAGPTGLRRSEFNSQMCAIFSGLANTAPRRDAAWAYIQFYDGIEARRIRTEAMVDEGLGRFVRPYLLRQYNVDGHYNDILRQLSPELEQTYQIAFEGGVPEPYGKNCQDVYEQMKKPLGEIAQSAIVRQAIDSNNPDLGKSEIRRILKAATADMNRRMLGLLPPEQRRRREYISWAVIALVFASFALLLARVSRVFSQVADVHSPTPSTSGGSVRRYRFAYLLLVPALGSIAMWMYWPLARGMLIAFQDYSVLGDSTWVGSANFADVLFDAEFWHSMRVSIAYALLFMIFGFWVPIALALLLSEVPRGKTVFRVIYYLPAILSGVVVIFLWKSFYSPDGLINDVVNGAIRLSNLLFRTHLPLNHSNLLDQRSSALLLCLLPTIWAGMGPGCLIYLAALKTVPDELYEAADIDGASTRVKVFHIALPSIKALVMINFIGAMIGAVRGAGGFVLAMTGGGPYDQSGGATEVVGLRLFYITFGYLKFGVGAAMAWVLGAMLIGFTVVQLRRLSRLEFRAAAHTG
jgi:ABC-type sugar transport system permease subunit/ABC-type glycerol-3-phosphate transport system substrate-binding protein